MSDKAVHAVGIRTNVLPSQQSRWYAATLQHLMLGTRTSERAFLMSLAVQDLADIATVALNGTMKSGY
jgi:hypothetical protein